MGKMFTVAVFVLAKENNKENVNIFMFITGKEYVSYGIFSFLYDELLLKRLS